MIVVLCQLRNFSAISWGEKDTFQWDYSEVCFVLELIFIVLAHQNNSPQIDMWHHSIILIQSQPIVALTPYYCVIRREVANYKLKSLTAKHLKLFYSGYNRNKYLTSNWIKVVCYPLIALLTCLNLRYSFME
jgi:hypothetical protein